MGGIIDTSRIFLFVPPEEYPEVKAAGATWDDVSKRWYVCEEDRSAKLSRWLGEEQSDPEYQIVSDRCFVASAESPCQKCGATIEVVCLYCEGGTDIETGEPLERFTVSNVTAVDENLARQLQGWPSFRRVTGEDENCELANHCPHCGAVQDEYLLHSEPDHVFFGLALHRPLDLTPIEGVVRVSGEYSFLL